MRGGVTSVLNNTSKANTSKALENHVLPAARITRRVFYGSFSSNSSSQSGLSICQTKQQYNYDQAYCGDNPLLQHSSDLDDGWEEAPMDAATRPATGMRLISPPRDTPSLTDQVIQIAYLAPWPSTCACLWSAQVYIPLQTCFTEQSGLQLSRRRNIRHGLQEQVNI